MMVSSYLLERFELTSLDADVRRHEPEDFVVRFRRAADRDRVLAAAPTGPPLPLVWRPWRRTSLASAGTFRFKVLLALRCVPLHVRRAEVVQRILGPCYAQITVVQLRDIPDDDERELFVTAWCLHPSLIRPEVAIFIPEPTLPGAVEAERSQLPGLRYVVSVRVVAVQDWSEAAIAPGDEDGGGHDDGGADAGGEPGPPRGPTPDLNPTPTWDSDSDGSIDSNFNGGHPGFDSRRHANCATPEVSTVPRSIFIGSLACPLVHGARRHASCATPEVRCVLIGSLACPLVPGARMGSLGRAAVVQEVGPPRRDPPGWARVLLLCWGRPVTRCRSRQNRTVPSMRLCSPRQLCLPMGAGWCHEMR
jgi:hypothetical protein